MSVGSRCLGSGKGLCNFGNDGNIISDLKTALKTRAEVRTKPGLTNPGDFGFRAQLEEDLLRRQNGQK